MIEFNRPFRLDEYPQCAFVGAGGKSSSIFRLASEHPGPVLISTTTHLGKEQSQLADAHLVINSLEDIRSIVIPSGSSTLLITGPLLADGRWSGLQPETIAALSELARASALPLLIEADGARGRFLKAPAAHEPAIPPFVDQVIVVVGLSALGKSLSSKIVHRPEQFSQLANIQLGEKISKSHLVQLFSRAFKAFIFHMIQQDKSAGMAGNIL